MIQIECSNVQCRIVAGIIPPDVATKISDACSFDVSGAEHQDLYKKGRWDGKKRLYNRQTRVFLPGLLRRVQNVLSGVGLASKVNRTTSRLPLVAYPIDQSGMELRPYQKDAIETAMEQKIGMLRLPTGGGKTFLAGRLFGQMCTDAVFLVHTKDLLYQAIDTFRSMYGEAYVGQIGDGIVEPREITVCTVQTAARAFKLHYERDQYAEGEDVWKEEEDREYDPIQSAAIRGAIRDCGAIIMDECHRVASQTATDVISEAKNASYRFGLSASPWRDDGADLVLEGVFGRVIVKVEASDLIDRGYLVAPLIKIAEVPARHYPRATKYQTVYTDYVTDNAVRNTMGVTAAVGMVKRGLSTMVLVRHIGHGEHIQEMLSEALGIEVPFISGRDDSDLRRGVIGGARSGTVRCFVATTIADEGLDIRNLGGLVLLGAGKSSVRALQRVGRVLRTSEGKNRAEVVDFNDQARWLIDHSAARIQMYRQEPKFTVIEL